jgi:hypothetical protein
MITISLADQPDTFLVGSENALEIRQKKLKPALLSGKSVAIDFGNVRGTSQSWMNVLLMGTLLDCGVDKLRLIHFNHCNDLVKELITFSVQKAQQRTQQAA